MAGLWGRESRLTLRAAPRLPHPDPHPRREAIAGLSLWAIARVARGLSGP
jgi:hypothetical protein